MGADLLSKLLGHSQREIPIGGGGLAKLRNQRLQFMSAGTKSLLLLWAQSRLFDTATHHGGKLVCQFGSLQAITLEGRF